MTAVLLDLDETIVRTASIEALRRSRDWPSVYAAFDRTTLPPRTGAFVAAIREIGPIGVVTSSPRPYAERLLAFHGLDVPVLVAYHDVTRRKPDPAPLIRALERLDVSPGDAVHVGDRPEDDAAAQAAGIGSIIIDWDGTAAVAGAYTNWDAVLRAIEEFRGRVP